MKIGVDLGGTNIRVALVDYGAITNSASEPCRSQEAADVVVNQIIGLIKQVITPSVKGIGIGVPSVVDTERGIVYNTANIPSWKEVHLKDILEKEFGIPVQLNNDCNCFVFGEHFFGQGKKYKNIVGITLGTGLGCGIVVDDKLLNGNNTGAGEIGEIPYLDKNYEYYCASAFFAEKYKVSAKEMARKASEGDKEALAIWGEYGTHLGNAIQLVVLAYDPPCLVIGGSIANAMPYFEDAMRKSLSNFVYPNSIQRLEIYRSEVKDVAMLGAAML